MPLSFSLINCHRPVAAGFVLGILLTGCSGLRMSQRTQLACPPLGKLPQSLWSEQQCDRRVVDGGAGGRACEPAQTQAGKPVPYASRGSRDWGGVAPGDWKRVKAAFANSPEIRLGQSWRKQQDRFRPAVVRTGWRDDTLWVYAEIEDADIFNSETRMNEPFFLKGDVFEIFLRPIGQRSYFEFHVGPENQHFQLRIPSVKAFARQTEGESESWKIRGPVVKSWTAVDRGRELWRLLVAIPIQAVVERGGSRSQWLFSFSRYDYTRGKKGAILSSSSPHAKLGFHRQQEWGVLRFH